MFFTYGCEDGPEVTVCLVDAGNFQLACADPKGNKFTIPIGRADNYVCMSPSDTRTVAEYCRLNREKND